MQGVGVFCLHSHIYSKSALFTLQAVRVTAMLTFLNLFECDEMCFFFFCLLYFCLKEDNLQPVFLGNGAILDYISGNTCG